MKQTCPGLLRGLAVMERAGYSRKQLKEAAATFVDALAPLR